MTDPNQATDGFTRRQFLAAGVALAGAPLLGFGAVAADMPHSVQELWADFDPRKDPIEVEIIREWKEDGATYRYVRYLIGTFKGQPARMAAIYGFPASGGKLPAVMHIHGGGQRASLGEVKLLVSRGYAALSLNWGGSGTGKAPFNTPEGANAGEPNTDWGAVDPTQLNVPGYDSMQPGPKQLFADREHPKNNNWYLLAVGCRRGLTFLEQQAQVDPDRIGVHGYSMGGNLTMYVAGTDHRVKAAVPGVGGTGWRWELHEFCGGKGLPQSKVNGDVDTFRRTLSFESYAALIKCPVLHRSGTNDFHGWMDDVYRTNVLIPNQPTRYCFSPHLNHRLIPEVAVGLPLWMDHYLKGGTALPETPGCELLLNNKDGIPSSKVTTSPHAWPVARCEIYYSVDADPRARFWRSADVTRADQSFTARLPLHSLDLPLFLFANVYYTLPEKVSMKQLPGNGDVSELCLSSLMASATPDQLRNAGMLATLKPGTLIDDFSKGLRDWYQLNAGNLTHQETWTRKLTDPLYRGPAGAALELTLLMPKTNRLSFVMNQNEWRSYRGPRNTFSCEREIKGDEKEQTLVFQPKDFTSPDGPLTSWDQVDQFGICAHYTDRRQPAQPAPLWNGPAARFTKLQWVKQS